MANIPANAVHGHEPPPRLIVRETLQGALEFSASEPQLQYQWMSHGPSSLFTAFGRVAAALEGCAPSITRNHELRCALPIDRHEFEMQRLVAAQRMGQRAQDSL